MKDAATGNTSKVFGFSGFDGLESDEESLKGLSTVSLTMFSILLNLLPDYEPRPNELGKRDKLLLCLMKLKLGSHPVQLYKSMMRLRASVLLLSINGGGG